MSGKRYCWDCMRHWEHDVIPPVDYGDVKAAPAFQVCGYCGCCKPVEDAE